MSNHPTADFLPGFHPIIRKWFGVKFHSPTPAQRKGWPAIQRGENTLILAPTGSGKTLAAFLWGIDRMIGMAEEGEKNQGVSILYLSPLKALGYDIERNLEEPLAELGAMADDEGMTFPSIGIGVRTGDTSQQERARIIRNPPHILITTPESLHLMLTSTRARSVLETVRWVIVDEIHTLSGNKRGVFLSVLLERLAHLTTREFVRIGLSATQRPLDEVARFLGGSRWVEVKEVKEKKEVKTGTAGTAVEVVEGGTTGTAGKMGTTETAGGDGRSRQLVPRPVTIVDAGIRRKMDLRVVCPVPDLSSLPEDTVWPSIYRTILDLVLEHNSTIIFANNRRLVERITAEVNLLAGKELVRAHHGSISRDERRKLERQLKNGELPGLVATASLELGIDMGAVDLVCQVESPRSVSTGLQRVGRAGHVYRAECVGRLIPKMRSDLLEMAVLTREMHRGEVDVIRVPRNCLDILAQQIIAMTAVEPRGLGELFDVIRQAYPFSELPYSHFLNVVEMVSGRYSPEIFKDLKPRVSWDRVNQRLYPLPGSRHLAIVNGGAIPDTGQFGVYLETGEGDQVRLGEMDEECIYETRQGDVVILGSNSWRVVSIGRDRVKVIPAPGKQGRMPFWKGEFRSRTFELGQKVGSFCREAMGKLDEPSFESWLKDTFFLDADAAANLRRYLALQMEKGGIVPDDRRLLLESFRDETGDLRLAVLTPFGGLFHLTWRLAILGKIKHDWGIELESLHNDSGILFRLTTGEVAPLVDAILSIRASEVRDLVIDALAGTPFFGLRFRHTAARSLLLPRYRPGRRTPLWLQRMKARDLLEIARRYDNFPVIVETFRECIQDHLLPEELERVLSGIERKEIEVVVRDSITPSPFASPLLFDFTAEYLYQYDAPKRAGTGGVEVVRDFLDEILEPEKMRSLTDESVLEEMKRKKRHETHEMRARSLSELVEILRTIGDVEENVLPSIVTDEVKAHIDRGISGKRILRIVVPTSPPSERYIAAEDFFLYMNAFASFPSVRARYRKIEDELAATGLFSVEHAGEEESRLKILKRYIECGVEVTVEELSDRYPFDETFLRKVLDELVAEKKLIPFDPGGSPYWLHADTLERAHRITLYRNRSRAVSCEPARYVRFLLDWQGITPASRKARVHSEEELCDVIERLQGFRMPSGSCESAVLAARFDRYRPGWLDDLIRTGEISWIGAPGGRGEGGLVMFATRESLPLLRKIYYGDQSAMYDDPLFRILAEKGATFFSDLVARTGLSSREVTERLWAWIWQGIVTNDSFHVIRCGKLKIFRGEDALSGRFPPGRYPVARRRAHRAKMKKRALFSFGGSGRWSLLPVLPGEGKGGGRSVTQPELESLAYMLFARYGILCREILQLEGVPVPWSEMIRILSRLEWRGEIRRGFFVKGLSGIQFALPPVVDRLALDSIREDEKRSSMVMVNASDPANLYGAGAPFPLVRVGDRQWRFYRNPGNYLILYGGRPCLAAEARGKRLYSLMELSPVQLKAAVELLRGLLPVEGTAKAVRGERSVEIHLWNGEPVSNSVLASYLEEAGFERIPSGFVLYRTFQ